MNENKNTSTAYCFMIKYETTRQNPAKSLKHRHRPRLHLALASYPVPWALGGDVADRRRVEPSRVTSTGRRSFVHRQLCCGRKYDTRAYTMTANFSTCAGLQSLLMKHLSPVAELSRAPKQVKIQIGHHARPRRASATAPLRTGAQR